MVQAEGAADCKAAQNSRKAAHGTPEEACAAVGQHQAREQSRLLVQ